MTGKPEFNKPWGALACGAASWLLLCSGPIWWVGLAAAMLAVILGGSAARSGSGNAGTLRGLFAVILAAAAAAVSVLILRAR